MALLLTVHPITRFLLEIIRTDEPAVFGTGMSISQNISLVLLAVAGALWWYILRQPRGVIMPLSSQALRTQHKPKNSSGRRS
jgi:phosphatidylglycerol:prolipoprotein diacylglycerol transferase